MTTHLANLLPLKLPVKKKRKRDEGQKNFENSHIDNVREEDRQNKTGTGWKRENRRLVKKFEKESKRKKFPQAVKN